MTDNRNTHVYRKQIVRITTHALVLERAWGRHAVVTVHDCGNHQREDNR